LRRLQSVQNAAAGLVAGCRRSDHITPVLRRLHWFPVGRRIEFKLALLIHKSLNGSTPRHLSDDCQLVSLRCQTPRRLRSSDVSTCVVSRTHTCFGDRAFQVAGPKLWTAGFTASVQHDSRPVQETAEDSFCLAETAVHSDSCFYCAVYKYFYYYYYYYYYFDRTALRNTLCRQQNETFGQQ